MGTLLTTPSTPISQVLLSTSSVYSTRLMYSFKPAFPSFYTTLKAAVPTCTPSSERKFTTFDLPRLPRRCNNPIFVEPILPVRLCRFVRDVVSEQSADVDPTDTTKSTAQDGQNDQVEEYSRAALAQQHVEDGDEIVEQIGKQEGGEEQIRLGRKLTPSSSIPCSCS